MHSDILSYSGRIRNDIDLVKRLVGSWRRYKAVRSPRLAATILNSMRATPGLPSAQDRVGAAGKQAEIASKFSLVPSALHSGGERRMFEPNYWRQGDKLWF